MLGEGAAAGRTHADAGLRLALLEALLDHDITGPLERIEMSAEIAVGGAHQPLEPDELDRTLPCCQCVERGHDPQPHRLVNDLVAATHCDTSLRWSQMPPRMSVPLCTAAIHQRNH